MSDWIVTAGDASGMEPFEIETDGPFKGVYQGLGPGQKAYSFVDAMKWVSYRMDIGDRVLTRKKEAT